MKKTKEEIEALRKASAVADACFEFICHTIQVGMTEKEVAQKMDEFMLAHGATAVSFDTIVGSGENSSLIHSTPSERQIQYGDIILLDFGCIVDGYCSDISRTIFIGEVKPAFQEIYDIVLAAQEEGVKTITSGMTGKEADAVCREVIVKNGYDFQHALGHGVGKEVHEEPVLSPKREDVRLENEMVFTIEPGIYLEGMFGVRIEDTVLLREGKVEPLNHATKEITIIPAENPNAKQ